MRVLLSFTVFLSVLTCASPVSSQAQSLSPPVLPRSVANVPSSTSPSTDSLSPFPSASESPDPDPSIRWNRFVPVTTFIAGAYTGVYLFERSRWWVDETSFHFDNHLDYAKNTDKMGHFYVSEIQALANARALEWSGVRPSRAALWGALISLAGQTNVEIHDGYSPKWGFDMYDQAANVLGVTWFYLHDRIPALRRYDIRLMYWNPELPPINQSRKTTPFTDDYMGLTFWVSAGISDVLPEALRPYWPRFLKPSIGVSLNDWNDHPDPDAYLSTHLSVDVDWREIIPRDSWLGRTSGDLLNRYHLPAPAIQLTPRPGFSLIFVGQ